MLHWGRSIRKWKIMLTTPYCPLQTWRKYDIDCSGYISAQELKVSKPPEIKCSLFTQQNQLHSQEEWPWEGEWLWPSAAPVRPVSPCCPSAPIKNLSRQNALFLTPRHSYSQRRFNNVACMWHSACAILMFLEQSLFHRLSWVTCLRSTRGRCPLRSWRSTQTPW